MQTVRIQQMRLIYIYLKSLENKVKFFHLIFWFDCVIDTGSLLWASAFLTYLFLLCFSYLFVHIFLHVFSSHFRLLLDCC